jgi:hypothetical protein
MADQDKINTEGRDKNAAQPLNAADDNAGPERYPQVAKDDSVQAGENRSFDPRVDAPTPRQGAGDGATPPSTQEGRTGPEGDPAEGKR